MQSLIFLNLVEKLSLIFFFLYAPSLASLLTSLRTCWDLHPKKKNASRKPWSGRFAFYFYFFCYFLLNHSMTSILSFVLVTAWLEIFFVVQLGTRWVSLSKIEEIIISWIERGLWRQSNFFWTSWYNCNGDVCQCREAALLLNGRQHSER